MQIFKFWQIVAPAIAAFSFGQEPLNAGDFVVIQCSTTKGDLPLSLRWYFQHRPLHSPLQPAGLTVNQIGDRVSVLQISSVTAAHNGDYTCTAENPAGISNFTATLNVNGIQQQQQQQQQQHLFPPINPRPASQRISINLH